MSCYHYIDIHIISHLILSYFIFFFFNDTATTEIYTLSLHDALPISTLLELETYRFPGHSRSDPGHYRPVEEVTAWKQKDPIARYEVTLEAQGLLSPKTKAEIESAVERQLDEAVAFAEQSPGPLPEDCLTDVFAE